MPKFRVLVREVYIAAYQVSGATTPEEALAIAVAAIAANDLPDSRVVYEDAVFEFSHFLPESTWTVEVIDEE